MSLDGEFNRLHHSIGRIEKKIDALYNKQDKYVTHKESNIKTGALAMLTLACAGKINWMDLLQFIKP